MRKYIIFIFLAIILGSCSHDNYKPCCKIKQPEEIQSKIIPVEIGNKWVYKYTEKNKYKGQIIYEISGIDTINFYDNNNKKQLRAYLINYKSNNKKLIRNNNLNYYIKCEDAVILGTVNNPKEKILTKGFPVHENPSKLIAEEKYIKYGGGDLFWIGKKNLKITIGTFTCWEMVKTDYAFDFNLKRFSFFKEYVDERRYYSKGVGLVKLDFLNEHSEKIFSYELISYELK